MKLDRRSALLAGLATPLAAAAQTSPPALADKPVPAGLPEPSETIDLWPKGVPGRPARLPVETVIERSSEAQLADRAVSGIANPRLVVFRPRIANGASVLIMPGGGYVRVVIDREGYEMARWFAARGFTAYVLFYRLPGDGWAAGPDTALSDAQRAMRLIRARAGRDGLNPEKVGAIGFSAGGHLCADLATRFAADTYKPVDAADKLGAQPFVAAPIYPVISMTAPIAHAGSREQLIGKDAPPALEAAHSPDRNVTKATPPCFLVHAEDDGTVPVENSLLFRAALRAAGVPVETHLFTAGGHGFGLRRAAGKPAEVWPELFLSWAQTQGFG
ncbi:MAG: alpha/beta hydrolase [Sphingomonas sp.]|uniref:alpha/beta hydrolase n=1 Tax=Sphingomonas sp. TaxID=28214 RepID=UPI001B2B6301|nr:alpha/beta hydrolase [Sphingomonas sp.]MBO9624685.1 alpha/beta hydrolase [Sphingomonas sp.]